MAQLQPGAKLVLIGLLALGGIFGLREAMYHGLIPTPGILKAVVPTKVVLPTLDINSKASESVKPLPLPSDRVADIKATPIRGEIWEWNAQANMIYANGAANTTEGSLMAKHGVNLQLFRQDSTDQMKLDLISCAQEIHDGADHCDKGANFVIIMGDGGGQFLAGLNPELKKLGTGYQAKVIGATGYSRGEDAFMAPPAVKADPQQARGLLVAGVLRDGDWNIAMKWAGDNNIPNNPDETTYDPDAINWVNTDDYIKAGDAYITGQTSSRKVVKNGHPTGETKIVTVNAVVTWTPGDVNVATKKGGLVKVVSSKEYRSQMPAVIIGPANFFQNNRDEIQGMLAATFEAGDQIKASDEVLHKASEISAKVYQDEGDETSKHGDYWYRYFKGVHQRDALGQWVDLGGSAVNNLADEKILFGLEGHNDNFRSTYTTFAAVDMQQYAIKFKDTPIPDVKDIEDKSYVLGAEAIMDNQGADADVPQYASITGNSVVSSRSYSITFETGSAVIAPAGELVMRTIKDSAEIASALTIAIDGYTDNTGSADINRRLSADRANSVASWLKTHAGKDFPDDRFKRVEGHGPDKPVAPNDTPQGRAANRRVEISLLGN
jgi:outer membrane protein OmpA-like peptidoglycan-associated protein